jgi:hypothetical protein
MAMRDGWIRLHRQVLDSAVFADDALFRLWCLCLLLANHHPGWAKIDGLAQPVQVQRGQFVTGRFALHSALYPRPRKSSPSASTVWRMLERLQTIGNLHIDSNSRFSIVTIVNYERYQGVGAQNEQVIEQPVNSRCTAGEQPVRTNNKGKKNLNGEEGKPPKAPSGTEGEIPATLKTEAFLAAWADWHQHRVEIKHKFTPTAERNALAKLANMGPDRAVAALRHSMANGWQGIIEPDTKGNSRGNQRTLPVGPGQLFDPNAGIGDPDFGKL